MSALGMVMLAPAARIGGIACNRNQSDDGGEAQTPPTEPTGGPEWHAMHDYFPVS
jgi:hypothetical protein